METNLTTVVLAGGMGTRLQGLFPHLPKPMVPVLGKPFLYWLTRFFSHHGVRDFVYSTGHLADAVERWISEEPMPHLRQRTRREKEPLGTGGALMNCLEDCGGWVLVTNGDSLCLNGLPQLMSLAGAQHLEGALIGVYNDDTTRYGSLAITDGMLTGFREKVPGQGYINAGTYLFAKQALKEVAMTGPGSIERDLIPRLLDAGRRLAVVQLVEAAFIDIGLPETVAQAAAFIEQNRDAFTEPSGDNP